MENKEPLSTPDEMHMKKVLIVEDDPEMRSFYQDYLKSIYEVEAAENGEEGLNKLAQNKYDLVMLDIMMPKVDGVTFLTRKAKDQNLAKIPVVVLTNLGNDEIIKQCFELGAKYYIFKAETTPDKILPTLQEAIRSGEQVS